MAPRTRPRDAASLVLTRGEGAALRVLMGRRPPRDRFMPDVWVFPGGRVEPEDARRPILRPMPPRRARAIAARWSPRHVRALATAAIRETFEETGLVLGELRGETLRPDHAPLTYLGRAITPAQSAIRYHARFFMAPAEAAGGRLRGNGELVDLTWVPIEDALALPIIDVTTAMLRHVRALAAGAEGAPGRARGEPAPDGALFVHYRAGVPRIVRE